MKMFNTFCIAVILGASSLVTVAAPAAADQTMPSCAAGDPVVWENSNSKVYHLKGDKYFGNTKSGTYACKSAADGAGYHAAKSSASSKKSGAASAATSAPDADADASPSAMSSTAPRKKHHRHHKSSTSASPAPTPTGT